MSRTDCRREMAELYVPQNTLAKARLDRNDIGEEIKRLMQDEWAKAGVFRLRKPYWPASV
jgi:hypothetical protein